MTVLFNAEWKWGFGYVLFKASPLVAVSDHIPEVHRLLYISSPDPVDVKTVLGVTSRMPRKFVLNQYEKLCIVKVGVLHEWYAGPSKQPPTRSLTLQGP